ncbi:amidohydrolase family protein [Ruania zhangjianzhongii]|uniref:amidohydrolase family protein n=1 Tax=Ruania zhangjianzhongii TaxID=2603206 RepID=UPI0011C7A5D5|nr:amidohydrolase family protein [Ruania zhangjianzhongii]
MPGLFLLRSAHVVTGDGRELPEADVVIADRRILQISDQRQEVPGAEVIDGRGKTLIPGLIDAHTHLDFLSVRSTVHSWIQTRFVLPRALAELVRHGVTAIRCMADPLTPVRRVRRRITAGRTVGPRMVIAGPALTAPGGHPEATLAKDNRWLQARIARRLDGPEQARRAVRELHAGGVDLIKFVYQGGVYGPDRVALQQLSVEVAQAIITEAHRLGLPVSAHTHYQDDVDTLLELGVDSIEHGVLEHDLAENEGLQMWSNSGTPLVPTLAIAALFAGPDGELYLDQASRNLTRAHRAGVRIVAGTDSMTGAMPANSMHEELRLMVEAGMTEAEALRAATTDAAALLGLNDRGGIAEGKAADLVLLGSNPLERIENVADIDLVFAGGVLVHRAPDRPRPPELAEYSVTGPDVLEYIDRTEATLPGEVVLRYDRSRFAAEGVRSLLAIAADSEVLRTETVTSGTDLVTQEWTCEIPAEETSLHAVAGARQISLTGTLRGKPVTRSYPLRGRTWMQLLQFDPATFITSTEQSLALVSIGASGRGALQLTDFELTKTGPSRPDPEQVETELVMPRWRRFWGAVLRHDAGTGDLLHQHVRGKEEQSLEPAARA